MESPSFGSLRPQPDLQLRLLGPLAIERHGAAVELPASRKVQALLAYLALAAAPVSRRRLSRLLWDVANDPRGELRWCLTKLRAILGADRVVASGGTIALDLGDCRIDAISLAAACEAGLDELDAASLRALAALSAGELLEGLEIDRCPEFNQWLTVQRRRFDAHRAALDSRLAELEAPASVRLPAAPDPPVTALRGNRAALAVMPLRALEESDALPGGIAAGLTYDVIARLARLRHFFVIAQGSVFALAARNLTPLEAGRKLDVDYVAGGTLRRRAGTLAITVELIETRSARLVWSETFERRLDDLFAVLEEIGDCIVSAVAAEIEIAERNVAVLKPPGSLNAWEAYHRGLWHMYRFTRAENEAARHFFETAIRLDPTFSRAYAGVSFTHWQSAFQRWGDYDREVAGAFDAAGRSLIADDRDPVAHWAMGRALWLRGRHEDSLAELQSSVGLSPNFALGHYAVSFVQSQSGDPAAAILSSDQSRKLSPYDPLLFGMLGTRAMALARLGDYQASAEWALKAAARPNAHANILAIAAHCLALAGRLDEARGFLAAIRRTRPDYRADDFIAAFHFAPDTIALFREGARRIGLN